MPKAMDIIEKVISKVASSVSDSNARITKAVEEVAGMNANAATARGRRIARKGEKILNKVINREKANLGGRFAIVDEMASGPQRLRVDPKLEYAASFARTLNEEKLDFLQDMTVVEGKTIGNRLGGQSWEMAAAKQYVDHLDRTAKFMINNYEDLTGLNKQGAKHTLYEAAKKGDPLFNKQQTMLKEFSEITGKNLTWEEFRNNYAGAIGGKLASSESKLYDAARNVAESKLQGYSAAPRFVNRELGYGYTAKQVAKTSLGIGATVGGVYGALTIPMKTVEAIANNTSNIKAGGNVAVI